MLVRARFDAAQTTPDNRKHWSNADPLSADAAAIPILSIEGLPAAYVPGDPVTFDVTLVGAENLASYYIDLILTAESATVGADAWFDVPAPPDSQYVFFNGPNDTDNFWATTATFGLQHFLSLSDLHDPDGDGTLDPVDTVAGVNDLIATVTLQTSPSLTGRLFLAFDAATLELDTHLEDPYEEPIPIPGFTELQETLASAEPTELPEIPEPSLLALMAAGAAVASLRRRRRSITRSA